MLEIVTAVKKEFAPGTVVTIGNFDGVHRGHQALLNRAYELAKVKRLVFIIVLFEPQPQEFFKAEHAPARLSTVLEKILAMQVLFNAKEIQGYILTLHFETQLAALSAHDFIQQILLQQLHMKHIVVGPDFHFGKRRIGDVVTLQQFAKQHHYQVEVLPSFFWDGQRVSSTCIRNALAKGDLSHAANLLNRAYTMTGAVVRGMQRGRTLGYPTANIALTRLQTVLRGVFAVHVHGLGERSLCGIANIGSRPTAAGTKTLLEVHIFDFEQDIYACQLTIEFLYYLRAEHKFASLEALKMQITQDIEKAKRILTLTGPQTSLSWEGQKSNINDHQL